MGSIVRPFLAPKVSRFQGSVQRLSFQISYVISPQVMMTVYIIQIAGCIFLALMAAWWMIPLSITYLFRISPPVIIKQVYSIITMYGLWLGVNIIYFKELEGSIQEYSERIFAQGLVAGRVHLMLVAVLVSLFFILANLTRSYYSLNKIEDEHDNSPIRSLIARLPVPAKILEAMLRLFLFLTIIAVVKSISSINQDIPNSGSLFSVEAFRFHLDNFWHRTSLYYILLLAWDLTILGANWKARTHSDAKYIGDFLKKQAFPVHLSGLAVSILMCLPRHSVQLSTYVDVFCLLAVGSAIVGCVFLSLSLLKYIKLLTKRSESALPPPPIGQTVESEASS